MNIKLLDNVKEGELLLEGRMDANASPEAEQILKQVAERYDRLVLNLKNLSYVSSAGLRVLKSLHMTMKKKGGILVIRNASPMVMEVFEMTGFSGLLNFE